MHKSTKNPGFTIVEIIVAVVVVAILASVTIISYNGAQQRARDTDRKSDISNLVKALEMYYSDNGQYPTTSTSSSTINSSWYNSGDSSWSEFTTLMSKYMDKVPTDPTNTTNLSGLSANGYTYAYYGNRASYCGGRAGQMYLLVYRLEASAKQQFTDGSCDSNDLGISYFNGGASFYRVVR